MDAYLYWPAYMPASAWCLGILVSITPPLPSTHQSPSSSSERCHLEDTGRQHGHIQYLTAVPVHWGQVCWVTTDSMTWSHTCCAARSLARFGFGDDSRENGWSIGAIAAILIKSIKIDIHVRCTMEFQQHTNTYIPQLHYSTGYYQKHTDQRWHCDNAGIFYSTCIFLLLFMERRCRHFKAVTSRGYGSILHELSMPCRSDGPTLFLMLKLLHTPSFHLSLIPCTSPSGPVWSRGTTGQW